MEVKLFGPDQEYVTVPVVVPEGEADKFKVVPAQTLWAVISPKVTAGAFTATVNSRVSDAVQTTSFTVLVAVMVTV